MRLRLHYKAALDGLNSYIGHLSTVGAPVELWIDGSFTTNKEDPNDIDLVIFSPAAVLNSLPDDKKQVFQTLKDRASMKAHFGLDVLFCPKENQEMRSYWRGWYGFDRNEHPGSVDDMDILGFRLHPLKGSESDRWSVWVNGNWRLTFEYRDGNAYVLDYEDYHWWPCTIPRIRASSSARFTFSRSA